MPKRLDRLLAVAGDLEQADHGFRAMAMDAAVVPVSGDSARRRSTGKALIARGSSDCSAAKPPCGMEKGLCEKSIFLSSSFHSNIGKSTTQANSNLSSSMFCATLLDLVRKAGEFREFVRIAGGEKGGVARLETKLTWSFGSVRRWRCWRHGPRGGRRQSRTDQRPWSSRAARAVEEEKPSPG